MKEIVKYLDEVEITEDIFATRKYHPKQQFEDYQITLFEHGKYEEVQLSQ